MHVIHVLEDEGQRDDVGLGDGRAHGSEVEVADGQRAGADLLDGVGLASEDAAVEHLKGDLAVRLLGQKLAELVHRDGVRIALDVDVPAFPFLGKGSGSH